MNKEKILGILEQVSVPALLCVVGLVLLLTPDTASAIIGQVAGVGLMVVGVVHLTQWLSDRTEPLRRLSVAVVCLGLGLWLLAHPLALAAWIGRFVGLYFILRGLQGLREGGSRTPSLITTLAGVLLVLSPMITSRLVLKGMGLAIALIGGIGLLQFFRQRSDGSDDGIIDV